MKISFSPILHSQALHRLLVVPQPQLNPAIPEVRLVRTPAARRSRPRVEPPQLRVREDRGSLEAPEHHALLYYRCTRSLNSPGRTRDGDNQLTLTPSCDGISSQTFCLHPLKT